MTMINSRTWTQGPATDAVPRRKRLPRRVAPLAALVTGLGSAAVALAPAAAADVPDSGSATYASTGAEQTFVVPAGVTSINVLAVGGRGGSGALGSTRGGFGASVDADLGVTPGQTLYVEVGGNGQDGILGAAGPGGFNGGGLGAPASGAGGGGASDVRTVPATDAGSLASRLIVAGGGGGAAIGGQGGDSAQDGNDGVATTCAIPDGGPGGGGTQTADGLGGTSSSSNAYGEVGAPGFGGRGGLNPPGSAGTAAGGGGGGGGYHGGGGGGAGPSCAGAGGAGSSYVDPTAGRSPSFDIDTADAPTVVINWLVGARPQVSTTAATSLGQTTATLNGVVNPGGLYTSYHFEYGTDTNYDSQTGYGELGPGTTQQVVSIDVSGLNPGTTYYFRLVATNPDGTATDSGGMSFTTASVPQAPVPPAPQATTTPASRVGRHGATVNGVVDPEGVETSYSFQYGRTSRYGSTTPVQAAGAGSLDEAVRAVLYGLPRHTRFHVRLVAVSAGGTTYGEDRTFRTR